MYYYILSYTILFPIILLSSSFSSPIILSSSSHLPIILIPLFSSLPFPSSSSSHSLSSSSFFPISPFLSSHLLIYPSLPFQSSHSKYTCRVFHNLIYIQSFSSLPSHLYSSIYHFIFLISSSFPSFFLSSSLPNPNIPSIRVGTSLCLFMFFQLSRVWPRTN